MIIRAAVGEKDGFPFRGGGSLGYISGIDGIQSWLPDMGRVISE